MALLDKKQLLKVVEDAIRESGWCFLHLPSVEIHPARYQLYRDGQSHRVRVYIWNLTPGGQNRPKDEWRIQATGVDHFEPEPDGKTLILGWQDEWEVFAGFDFSCHQGNLGYSPSIQLREAALHQAIVSGFAPHNKGNGELAIAFRPDCLATYVANIESLHECGQTAGEREILSRVGQDPDGIDDAEVEETIAEPRRYAVLATKRALRETGFRKRVLTAYDQSCAMCGVQLRLLDGAHILPAAHPDSTDGTDNGVALCALHHRAFDRAFVTFDHAFRIHVNENMTDELKAANLDSGLEAFKDALHPDLASLPSDEQDRPARCFVDAANKLRGWSL